MKLTGDCVLSQMNVNPVDTKGVLKLYHYESCDDNSPETLKQVRGVVIDSSNNRIVMRSFPYTHEIIGAQESYPFLKDSRRNLYFSSNEGTVIRVFFHGDSWHVSTHRRIDAFQSHWGGPFSFGDYFKIAIEMNLGQPIEEFFKTLNPDHQYVFMLFSTPQTRIASPILPYPFFTLVATVVDGEFNFTPTVDRITTQMNLPFNKEISDIENINNYLAMCENDIRTQGIFVVSTDVESGEQTFYKILSNRYHELSLLRGNAYDIPTRYVELKLQSPEMLSKFTHLFSEYTNVFEMIESRISRLIGHMVFKYRERFVKNKYAPVHRVLYPFMKHIRRVCEVNNLADISRITVTNCFQEQPVVYIMKMLAVEF